MFNAFNVFYYADIILNTTSYLLNNITHTYYIKKLVVGFMVGLMARHAKYSLL